MRRLVYLIAFLPFVFSSCEDDTVNDILGTELPVSQIIDGLKTALEVSTDTSTTVLSRFDGYFGDPDVKLDMPLATRAAIEALQNKQISIAGINVSGADLYAGTQILGVSIGGLQNQEDALVEGLNRVAENAANTAAPIFKDAILDMGILDASSILFSSSDTAATAYLRQSAGGDLYQAYEPKVDSTLNQVMVGNVSAVKSYEDFVADYNALLATGIPGFGNLGTLLNMNPIAQEDLSAYATQKALDGLFDKMGEEEEAIRNDPTARVTDLLSLVFGLLD